MPPCPPISRSVGRPASPAPRRSRKAPPRPKGKRSLTIRFDANVAPGLDWTFEPETTSMTLRTGVTATVFFKVHNLANRETAANAVYNVHAGHRGRLVRQDFLLLLQRAASRSRRKRGIAGRVLPRSGARAGHAIWTPSTRSRFPTRYLRRPAPASRSLLRPGGGGDAETLTNSAVSRRRGNTTSRPRQAGREDEEGQKWPTRTPSRITITTSSIRARGR